MIQALRYEPRGQHQRFEPREQQSSEPEQRHIHLHLNLHLHLSFPRLYLRFRALRRRFLPLSVTGMLRIFAALAGATSLAFWVVWMADDTRISTLLYTLASNIITAGLVLAWGAATLGGLPLLISAWRNSPRVRFLLILPFILPLIWLSFLIVVNLWSSTILEIFNQLPPDGIGALLLNLLAFPLIGAILFHRAFRQAEIAETTLRFAGKLSIIVVGDLVLLLLGGFLFCLSLVQIGTSWSDLLPPLLGMCLTVLVAVSALIFRPRLHEHAQARPKDASPSDFGSSEEPRGYRG